MDNDNPITKPWSPVKGQVVALPSSPPQVLQSVDCSRGTNLGGEEWMEKTDKLLKEEEERITDKNE